MVDPLKWEFMIGNGCSYGLCGWGNNELQYYRSQNAVVANGELTITARQENFGGAIYPSARLRIKGCQSTFSSYIRNKCALTAFIFTVDDVVAASGKQYNDKRRRPVNCTRATWQVASQGLPYAHKITPFRGTR